MAIGLKTQPKPDSVSTFIDSWEPDLAQEGRVLCEIMQKATGQPAVRWGAKMIGFGVYTYHYASGRSGDWPPVACAPRKNGMTLYLMDGQEHYKDKLAHMSLKGGGKSCIYLKKLDQIDLADLSKIVTESYNRTIKAHETK